MFGGSEFKMHMGGFQNAFGMGEDDDDDENYEDDEDEEVGKGEKQKSNVKKEIDNKKLYEILGLEPQCDIQLVKKAYRTKAKEAHPDRGGDAEEFKNLSRAYEILSKEDTKEIYDKYGQKGLDEGVGDNPLADLFGFGGKKSKGNDIKKVRPKEVTQVVTLEDVFVGKMITLKIQKKKLCDSCSGTGGTNSQTCDTCQGARVRIANVMVGPGMYMQQPMPCDKCKARGFIIEEADICVACKGDRIVEGEKDIEVAIEKGVGDKHKFELVGAGDEYPGAHSGDLIVEIQISPHERFVRKGADLYYSQKISLKESLIGTHFQVKLLDDEILFVQTRPGEVIRPNQICMIPNKGMPFHNDSMSFGHLFVQFEVEFPKSDSLSQEQISQLELVLPGPAKTKLPENIEPLILQQFDPENTNPNIEGGQHKENNEEDQEHGQGGVQCAQQ